MGGIFCFAQNKELVLPQFFQFDPQNFILTSVVFPFMLLAANETIAVTTISDCCIEHFDDSISRVAQPIIKNPSKIINEDVDPANS